MIETQMIKDTVNELLVSENANAIEDETALLTSSKLDSFGYAVLWIELNEEYGCFSVEYTNGINYETYTLGDVIKRVQEHVS